MKKKILILFIAITCLSACYDVENPNDFVTIRSTNSKYFEMELIIKNIGRGNIHTFDISEYEFDTHLWLYFESINGKVEANDIIWTTQKGELYYPPKKKNIKGYIQIDSSKILINLFYPYYSDGVNLDHWEEFDKNGEYEVVLKLDSISDVIFNNPYSNFINPYGN